MRKIIYFALIGLSVMMVACATATATVAPKPTPPAPVVRKSGTIRFSIGGDPNVRDIPRLMAIDALKAQGYTVETTTFASNDLIASAMQRGDIEIGDLTSNLAWSAIAKGVDIRSVVGRTNMTFYLVTKQSIKTCQDLEGQRLAFSNRQAVGYIMYDKYLKENCPGVNPQILLIANSKNRVAALEAGELDGAYLELEDWLPLSSRAGTSFHILLDFAKQFPQVFFSPFSVRRTWAEQNPEAVKDFIRALLAANRRVIANPQVLRDEIVKRLAIDAVQAQKLADTYLALKVWDANGGMNQDSLAYTIDFLSANGTVSKGIQINDVADLSYLNAVLDEIGR